MRSLFVMDPLDRIDVRTDTTWMLMRACQARGWSVDACEPTDLRLTGRGLEATARSIALSDAPPHLVPGPASDRALSDWDVAWMRKDPPFDEGYLFALLLLDRARPHTLVVNDPAQVALGNEKLLALRWPHLAVDTVVAADPRWIRAVVEDFEKAVLKPWNGCGGQGVLLTSSQDPNLPALLEILTDQGCRHVLVQRQLSGAGRGDKRVLLVEGDPKGWFLRVPVPGDHRANLHVGGRAVPCDLDERDRAICAAVGPAMKEAGFVFVGLDIIDGMLTEINVTSPTGVQEADRFLDVRVEDDILDAVARRARILPGGTP
ncbi:MAG: glutathione synthase [Deltaproteobacteria bacterium]|nr:glutathione synthase [Deltaproteobacteria bacterium]